jgi:hypothetical protein
MKGKITYPENLEEDALDLLKKILVINPKERISIKEIKKHPFYQKGRREFIKMHPSLIKTAIKKIESKSVEKDKNIEKKESKDINKINGELKGKEKESDNIQNYIFRKKRKILIDNLISKTDESNLKDLKSNFNKIKAENNNKIIFKIKHKIRKNIDFNKINNLLNTTSIKTTSKRKKNNFIFNSISQNKDKNVFDLIKQKIDKANLDRNQSRTNDKIIKENYTFDNKNDINNIFFTSSRNKKQIFLNDHNFINKKNGVNRLNIRNKLINAKKNYTTKINKNNLSNYNEESFGFLTIRPKKIKKDIDQMTNQLNNTTKQIKEKIKLKIFFL